MKSKIIFVGLVTILVLSGCNLFQKNKKDLTTAETNTVSLDDFCATYLSTSGPTDPNAGSPVSSTSRLCVKNGDFSSGFFIDGSFVGMVGYCLKNESYNCNSVAPAWCSSESNTCGAGKSPVLTPSTGIGFLDNDPSLLVKTASKKIAGFDAECYQLDLKRVPSEQNTSGITKYEICYHPNKKIILYTQYADTGNIGGISTMEVKELVSPAPSDFLTLPVAVK